MTEQPIFKIEEKDGEIVVSSTFELRMPVAVAKGVSGDPGKAICLLLSQRIANDLQDGAAEINTYLKERKERAA